MSKCQLAFTHFSQFMYFSQIPALFLAYIKPLQSKIQVSYGKGG